MEDIMSHDHGQKKHPDLPSKRESAYGRLKSCLKKLHGKPEFLKKYSAVIQTKLNRGLLKRLSIKCQLDCNITNPIIHLLICRKQTQKLE